jgi:hypothetical protein
MTVDRPACHTARMRRAPSGRLFPAFLLSAPLVLMAGPVAAAPVIEPLVLEFTAGGQSVQAVIVTNRGPAPLIGAAVACRFFDAHTPLEEVMAPVPDLAPQARVEVTLVSSHPRLATHTQCRLRVGGP